MSLTVCVFCGSRFGARSKYQEIASHTGTGIGTRGWRLVYGGGDVGLMKVVADATMQSGGRVTGFIPQKLMELEVGKRNITELIINDSMFERKERMIDESDAFVLLPGGLGTLDELLEVMTLKQLRYHTKPIILVDVDGYWRKTVNLVELVINEGFADATAIDLIEMCEEPSALFDMIEERCGAVERAN